MFIRSVSCPISNRLAVGRDNTSKRSLGFSKLNSTILTLAMVVCQVPMMP